MSARKRESSMERDKPREDKERSRSRDRDRDRDRDRNRDRDRDRDRDRYRDRSRDRDRSHDRDRDREWRRNPTSFRPRLAFDDPTTQDARVFVANLPTDRISERDLNDYFSKHGNVLGEELNDNVMELII